MNSRAGLLPLIGWSVFWTYLLMPTSLALRLDGFPLNTKPELLALLAALGLVGATAGAWLLRSPGSRYRSPPRRRSWPLVVASSLFAVLIPVKLFYPRQDAIALCIRSPEILAVGCVWSPEGFVAGFPPGASRYETLVQFDPGGGRPWRLGFVNTITFNLYGNPADSRDGWRERFRLNQANPFEAELRVSPRLTTLLRERFADGDGRIVFVGKVRGELVLGSEIMASRALTPGRLDELATFRMSLPGDELTGLAWRYRNYGCPTQDCHRTMVFQTLRVHDSLLDLRVEVPGTTQSLALGFGSLSLRSGDWWAVVARRLEAVALWCFGWAVGVVPLAQALVGLLRASLVPAPSGAWRWLLSFGLGLGAATLLSWGLEAWLVPRGPYGGIFTAAASFWLTLPATTLLGLAAASEAWRRAIARGLREADRLQILRVWMLPFLVYVLATTAIRGLAQDDVVPLTAGDDALGYAGLAKDLLRDQRLLADQPSLFTKPGFIYLRAFLYWLLGEGERYVSVVVAAAFLAVYALVGHVVFATLAEAIARSRQSITRWGMLALYAGIAVWLTNAFLAYGAAWAGLLFSEGPAWLLVTVSAVMLAHAVVEDRIAPRSVALVGVPFAAACLFRTQLALLTPLVAGAFLLLRRSGPDRRGALATGFLLPLVTAGVLIVGHVLAAPLPTWTQVELGVGHNTSVKRGRSLGDVFAMDISRLFPSRSTWIVTGLFFALLVTDMLHEGRTGGWRRGARVAGFGALAILGGFILQVPILPAPYAPRMIMPTYFLLITLMVVWADRLSRPALDPTGHPSV